MLSFITAVCFRVFDSDRDGLLSRQELSRATQVLHTIETENAGEGEVKGDPAGEGEEVSASESQRVESVPPEAPEQTAQSAIRNFSNKHVSIVSMDIVRSALSFIGFAGGLFDRGGVHSVGDLCWLSLDSTAERAL